MEFQDTMRIWRVRGPPDFFMTLACNPRWPEITDALEPQPGQHLPDRSEVAYNVFQTKLNIFLDDIKAEIVFRPIHAALYTSEFQKKGLPHVHVLLWLSLPQQPEMVISKIPAVAHSTTKGKEVSSEDRTLDIAGVPMQLSFKRRNSSSATSKAAKKFRDNKGKPDCKT